ncbi:uncharacterized protein MELLADRAFT_67839 [Melampsora larici-populina 98AG31]|uniref:Uncharacterized protein n=1 Tax=Melampsora larici-populina (strain 98AG31 / pathotype 3-4-7) TaxID=747676 RepID=F4S4M3_MELLP|nr:uncharacterized protein MELLADRAFT_67839 [Melampsora larici-populina 98AG31]EGG00446.1 hypothetical protein MELLADRAFT_67839 [Melampsora larici-populina 98AG31]
MFLPSLLLLRHSTLIHYVGVVGDESTPSNIRDRGMVSVRTGIATSGLNNNDSYATGILLTSRASPRHCLRSGNVYAMTFRLIASNTSSIDHLHFNPKHVIDLGVSSVSKLANLRKTMDKVSITAHGHVNSRMSILEVGSIVPTVVITITSVDKDPTTLSPVVWSTKHYIKGQVQETISINKCHEGAEIIVHGVIKDYDETEEMWASEVDSISIIKGSDIPMERKILHTVQPVNTPSSTVSVDSVGSGLADYSGMVLSYDGADIDLGQALRELFSDNHPSTPTLSERKRGRDEAQM